MTGPGHDTESYLRDYVARLRQHGAEPVVLRPDDERRIAEILPTLDGLLLSGGADVGPSRYGQAVDQAANVQCDLARDALEFALLQAVTGRDLPVLGICRGFQLLNVHLGGTLVQDLPGHRADGEGRSVVHLIRIDAGSRLARITGLSEAGVNSRHHQGVRADELARPLRATAVSPDGLVEALEHPDRRWLIGVQCHPERQDEMPAAFGALFEDFVTESRRVPGRVF